MTTTTTWAGASGGDFFGDPVESPVKCLAHFLLAGFTWILGFSVDVCIAMDMFLVSLVSLPESRVESSPVVSRLGACRKLPGRRS